MDLGDRIERDFTYQPPSEDSIWKMKSIRDHAKVLAFLIDAYVPSGREQSLAITKLEEVSMWANAGIARNQPAPADNEQLSLFKPAGGCRNGTCKCGKNNAEPI